jgi:hypothetical protein
MYKKKSIKKNIVSKNKIMYRKKNNVSEKIMYQV